MSTKRRVAAHDLALILAIVSPSGFCFVALKVGPREIPPLVLAMLAIAPYCPHSLPTAGA